MRRFLTRFFLFFQRKKNNMGNLPSVPGIPGIPGIPGLQGGKPAAVIDGTAIAAIIRGEIAAEVLQAS